MASKVQSEKSDSKDSQQFTYASAVTSPRPLEERSLPKSSSNKEKFPIEAVEPVQHIRRKASHHHCMYADLRRHNYVKKFEELVKCEQKTHLEILQAKCSGNCTLVVTDTSPHKNDAEPSNDFVQYGHLTGLSDDQIAYVSQSADHWNGVIIKAKNRENEVCRAAILRSNFSHTDTKLYIAFDEVNKIKVWERFKRALTQKQKVKVHVKFDLKNSYFRSLSQSVHRIPQTVIAKIMPDAQSSCTLDHENLQLEKHLPSNNFSEDQMQALKMILGSASNGPPCLITGPFGTGKSHLLAAAAYWLFKESRTTKKPARILVCTQQRESTDNFCSLFRNFMLGDKEATIFIVRDYGFHNRKLRKWYKTVNEFKEYMGNIDVDSQDMENFLIIMPCLTSLSVQKAKFLPPDFFTHIFIDEAAQMREPEAIAPLSMGSENTKVVIAGDPWQVGPSMLVLGEEARKHGLAISMLERLLSFYHSASSPPDFKKMVSFLDRCHRCHQQILNLSARLFYKTDLKIPENDPLVYHPKFQYPIQFICSSINETELSKTTRNHEEAKIILDYALKIIRNWPKKAWGDDLDMCIMSPSRSQLTVILELIKSDSGNYSSKLMEIRRVPTFFMQGKEYKVLLLSTSEPMTQNGASANPTKSLCNPYVFNTAITRAQSLVVCVGNPFLLLRVEASMVKNPEYKEIGKCWSNYFKCCLENRTMEIPESLGVPKDKQEEILLKIKELAEEQLKEKIQYPPQMDNVIEEENESQSTVFAETSRSMISPDVSTADVESKTVEPMSNESEESLNEAQSLPELEIHEPSESESSRIEVQSPSTPMSEFEKSYKFGGCLGGGGFGVVLSVKYVLDKCDYALKVIPLPEEDGKQEKLLREIVALAPLDHPHIVRYSHSWKERAPEDWKDKQGWKEMRSRFLSFAKKISSSSSTPATQSQTIARSSQTSGTSIVDSIVSFRQSPQMTRKAAISSQSSTNPSMKTHQTQSPSQISTATLATLTSTDTLIKRLCESPPTCLFIRMELCKEETLKDLLAKNNGENKRKKKDMFDYFEQMLSALSYIHGKGFIHRDLKPSNIFFSREEGRLKIGDFGLVTTDITNDTMALYSEKKSRYQAGTRTYASPEQLAGDPCSSKADIYTLGLICFELHFICKTSMELVKVLTALKDSGRFPKDFPKRIFREIPELIKWMLASEPSARPSADEILGSDKFRDLKRKENRKKAAQQPYIPLL